MLSKEEYIKKIKSVNKLSDNKKQYYIEMAERISSKGMPIILNSFHLSNLAGLKWNVIRVLIDDNVKSYHKFYISKKNKKDKRMILAPSKELEHIQRFIYEKILLKIEINDSAYGFVNNKSIKSNAEYHIGAEKILNIDLKDFFPSIDSRRIYYVFNKVCGYDKTLSYCLTRLTTYRNMLPQGACTSPILSNIVSYKMDFRLQKLAEKMNLKYTRYADDITFSGDKEQINNNLLKLITKIIEEEGYTVNIGKIHMATKSSRQEITGLIINNGVADVPQKYIKISIKQENIYLGLLMAVIVDL